MPWAWGTSAWWHVSAWKTYRESALRELKEEIGIIWDLKLVDKYMFKLKEEDHTYFSCLYELVHEWPFSFDDWEVEFVKWFSINEIKDLLNSWESMHPELRFILENYYL